jgi:general secretion pathway protein L
MLSPSRDAILLDQDGDGLSVFERRGTQVERLGRVDGDGTAAARAAGPEGPEGRDVILRIPNGPVLHKTISVPQAARRDLAAFMALEMDRETPFSADEVFWSARVGRRDRAGESFTVTLDVVPRVAIDALIAQAMEAGFVPDVLETLPSSEEPGAPSVRIAIGNPTQGDFATVSRSMRLAAALGAILLLLALALPLTLQALALADVEDAIAAAKIAAAPALTARGGEEDEASAALRAAGVDRIDPLAVLAAVTQAVPDDSSLTQFSLQGRTLTLSGRSRSPPALLAALAAAPLLIDPGFTAPTTRESDTSEQFTLSATIAGDGP